jgi:hypothetical protein
VGGPVAAIDEVIGRGRRNTRAPLNLQSPSDDGLVAPHAVGLTPQGVACLQQDPELSDR